MATTSVGRGAGSAGPCSGLGREKGYGIIPADGIQAEKERRLLLERKLTIPEAAKAMGIGVTSLRRIIADGRLPVLNILHKVLILESDVETFLQGARVTVKQTKNTSNRLPPLPKCVTESEHLK